MKHLELFAGIGGFRRALELLGRDLDFPVECVGFSEIDEKAVQTYKLNFCPSATEIEIGDIVKFTSEDKNVKQLPKFDLLTGGFPCQTFSMMGKQAGFEEERGQMFFRIIDILKVKKPNYILLENVKNLFSHDKGKTFGRILDELENLGYNVSYDIFNTADFGLPQKRNRVLIFGTQQKKNKSKLGEFNALNVKKFFDKNSANHRVFLYHTVNDILDVNVDQKYYLSEKIKPTLLSDGSANFKSKSDINQVIARPLTATMHKMHRACQDNYYSQDFIDSKGKINPVKTLNKKELAGLQIRKLTPEEAFALQGFPKEFAQKAMKAGLKDGALYKQAGNAVSVNVVYAVLFYLIENHFIKTGD